MTHRSTLAAIAIGAALMAGCPDGDDKANAGPSKEDYETAISALVEPVALIAAYQPYLKQPERKGKYQPLRRPDQEKACFHAANEIRHATNAAVQKFRRTKSTVLKEFVPIFIKVTKSCAAPDEMPEVDKCAEEVQALDKLLEETAKAATAAGVKKKFPRIGKEAITDLARKKITPFKTALGPGKNERILWHKLRDDKATPPDVISACHLAHSEAEGVWEEFEKGDSEVRKLAAIHMLAVKSQCDQIEITDGIQIGVRACQDEKDFDDKPECTLACANAKTRLGMGVPAAAFASLEDDYKEICEKDAGP